MKLTTAFIKSIDTAGRYYDDQAPGLYVLAQARTSTRTGETLLRLSYVQRTTIKGKRVDIGLGSPKWGATTLTEARRRALENYRIARNGGDPRTPKNVPTVPSFREAFEAALEVQRGTWRDGGKSEKQWTSTMDTYVLPKLGDRPIDSIEAGDILRVLTPIWHDKHETARRLKQRISYVLRWAVAEGHRTDDPTAAVTAALPRNGKGAQHHKAVHHSKVGEVLAKVRASKAHDSTKGAVELAILTACRSNEIRGLRWEEVNFEERIVSIGADRMKAGKAHRVPLSERAVEVLEDAHERTGGRGLVFPSVTGRKLSDNALSKLFRDLGVDGTLHGMRSAFRDHAGESGVSREVAERCLAHTVKNAAERAYSRSDLIEQRRPVMDKWSRYVTGTPGGKVVAIRG